MLLAHVRHNQPNLAAAVFSSDVTEFEFFIAELLGDALPPDMPGPRDEGSSSPPPVREGRWWRRFRSKKDASRTSMWRKSRRKPKGFASGSASGSASDASDGEGSPPERTAPTHYALNMAHAPPLLAGDDDYDVESGSSPTSGSGRFGAEGPPSPAHVRGPLYGGARASKGPSYSLSSSLSPWAARPQRGNRSSPLPTSVG